MIVLDTHVWLWWLHDPSHLSAKARDLVEENERDGLLVVSAISVWEVALKVQIGKLSIPVDIHRWLGLARSHPRLRIIDLGPEDAVASTLLPGEFHRDPADRMIVALARRLGVPLVTRDKRVLSYPHVTAVW